MKTIELQIPDGKKAEWVNGVLTLVDEKVKDNRPITERIKTFQDAYNELGFNHHCVQAYESFTRFEDANLKDIIAYLKLRIITAALNEGWTPKFTEGEGRYYPWFWLYTEDELSDKSNDWKQERALMTTSDYETEYAGFACALSYYAPSYPYTNFASRLYFKDNNIATYCGKQFIQLWADYLLIRK